MIVKPTQIIPDDARRPTHAVVKAVLIEIRVKGTDDRYATREDVAKNRQTQRRLGGDMNHIGPKRVYR